MYEGLILVILMTSVSCLDAYEMLVAVPDKICHQHRIIFTDKLWSQQDHGVVLQIEYPCTRYNLSGDVAKTFRVDFTLSLELSISTLINSNLDFLSQ